MLESLSGGRILAERVGSGPVRVVGLHGWARTSKDLLGPLAGLDALAVDLPGFGLSRGPGQRHVQGMLPLGQGQGRALRCGQARPFQGERRSARQPRAVPLAR